MLFCRCLCVCVSLSPTPIPPPHPFPSSCAHLPFLPRCHPSPYTCSLSPVPTAPLHLYLPVLFFVMHAPHFHSTFALCTPLHERVGLKILQRRNSEQRGDRRPPLQLLRYGPTQLRSQKALKLAHNVLQREGVLAAVALHAEHTERVGNGAGVKLKASGNVAERVCAAALPALPSCSECSSEQCFSRIKM